MQDAMAMIKNELGRDAVILHTRKLKKGGFFGFFSRELIEVVAAVEEPKHPEVKKNANPNKTASNFVPLIPAKSVEKAIVATTEPVVSGAMEQEIKELRKMVEQVLGQLPQSKTADANEEESLFYQILCQNDIDKSIVQQLLQGMPTSNSLLTAQADEAKKLILQRMRLVLEKVEPIQLDHETCKIVALIGSTGVGKTTTIAKIAANFSLKDGYKVAMITSDTYRIAAVEQLKTYADIIGVSLDIVYTHEELKEALARHSDKNLILIDTAGRSPSNGDQLEELQKLLSVNPKIEKHLVISATTKYKDAVEVVEKFSVCQPEKFLFTKVDETSNWGTLFNLLYRYPIKLSYITNGQNVPDDIEIANADQFAQRLLQE